MVCTIKVQIDCTQSLSFHLVIERLEQARCTTARETGVNEIFVLLPILRAYRSLAPVSQLLWTREERDCVKSKVQTSRPSFVQRTTYFLCAFGTDKPTRAFCLDD